MMQPRFHNTQYMAWNKYYVVVTDQPAIQPEEVMAKLKLRGYVKNGRSNFAATNKSNDLFIGNYGNLLIIVDPDLPIALFEESPSAVEKLFTDVFPNAEIAALVENSTVDEFGYAILKNGRRIRVKHGCDGEIYTDIGDFLVEEQLMLSCEIFSKEEIEEMSMDMDEEAVKNAIQFEASWRIPSELSKRYFGCVIDNLPPDDIQLTHFIKSQHY